MKMRSCVLNLGAVWNKVESHNVYKSSSSLFYDILSINTRMIMYLYMFLTSTKYAVEIHFDSANHAI